MLGHQLSPTRSCLALVAAVSNFVMWPTSPARRTSNIRLQSFIPSIAQPRMCASCPWHCVIRYGFVRLHVDVHQVSVSFLHNVLHKHVCQQDVRHPSQTTCRMSMPSLIDCRNHSMNVTRQQSSRKICFVTIRSTIPVRSALLRHTSSSLTVVFVTKPPKLHFPILQHRTCCCRSRTDSSRSMYCVHIQGLGGGGM